MALAYNVHAEVILYLQEGSATRMVEFPMKSGHRVKLYSVCSYSAGETYPSDECRRRVL
jgi:hypothetical protein